MKRRSFLIAAVALAVASPAMAQGGGGRRGGFGGGFGGGGGGLFMLMIPEVQKELKLEETQIELLRGLMPQRGQGGRRGGEDFRNLSEEERAKRIAEFRAEAEKRQAEQEKKIGEILDAKQVVRYKQLGIQRAGIRAISQKPVADQLKLTPDQRTKVQAALEAEGPAMRALFQGGAEGQRPDFQVLGPKMQEIRTATDAKLNAIMTSAQKTQFAGMQGAPFKFPEGGFGRRGGNRGGGNQN
jgi:hypothetical protein